MLDAYGNDMLAAADDITEFYKAALDEIEGLPGNGNVDANGNEVEGLREGVYQMIHN